MDQEQAVVEAISSHEQVSYGVNIIIMAVMAIGWYWVKGVIANQKIADDKIGDLTTKLAVNSANDDNHQAQFKKLEEWMLRIETKIDGLKNM